MGPYFYFVSHTRREYFSIDALGGGVKFTAIGRTLASRAFELMLSTCIKGRWAGDSVALISDSDTEFVEIREKYADVSANAILEVFSHDGLHDLGPAADQENHLFVQLCYLAATNQAPRLSEALKEHFGPDYLRRYKAACENSQRQSVVKDIVPTRK